VGNAGGALGQLAPVRWGGHVTEPTFDHYNIFYQNTIILYHNLFVELLGIIVLDIKTSRQIQKSFLY
jgi:hypothetical protein